MQHSSCAAQRRKPTIHHRGQQLHRGSSQEETGGEEGERGRGREGIALIRLASYRFLLASCTVVVPMELRVWVTHREVFLPHELDPGFGVGVEMGGGGGIAHICLASY